MSPHDILIIAASLTALGVSLWCLNCVHRLQLEMYALELKMERFRADQLCAVNTQLDRLGRQFEALLDFLSDHNAANAPASEAAAIDAAHLKEGSQHE